MQLVRKSSKHGLGFSAVLLIFVLTLLGSSPVLQGQTAGKERRGRGATAPAGVSADAASFPNTIVTADLGEKLKAGKNVIWCATFKLAWDQACSFFGGKLGLDGRPDLARTLNEEVFTPKDSDSSSSIVFGGLWTQTARHQLLTDMRVRFGSTEGAQLLPPADPGAVIAYALLHKSLPFKYRFARSKLPFEFAGKKVASWNVLFGDDHTKVLNQIRLLSYRGPDSFVLEVHTNSASDRLILAKIPPKPTLRQTIAAVESRIKGDEFRLNDDNRFVAPVLDFNLVKDYGELAGREIVAPSTARGLPVLAAFQRVQFRLDESGASLESEAGFSLGVPPPKASFLFDRPFLVLIQRTGSSRPYFAAWIGNAELMPKMPAPAGPPKAGEPDTMNAKVRRLSGLGRDPFGRLSRSAKIYPESAVVPLHVRKKVLPKFPPAARMLGYRGKVLCELIVGKDGRVEATRVVVSSHETFDQAALDAARRWVFSPPVTPNNKHVRVYHCVLFNFSLTPPSKAQPGKQ